uniref:INCENP_ARK-bind domain-containing protein n=1 Tax=Angiostrongylus cantonensis TaxID=6313 RepID=A0A0K0D6Z3_ANGCA
MPSKNRTRKPSSAAIATSECSKELRDLPEKDYRQLLVSVAELPKKILASESGGDFPGGGGDAVTCGMEQEELTPAAQSCLNKLVDEIKSGGTVVDQKIGKSATFDDSFITRRIESLSAFSLTKKKPVRYEKEVMKFIDEDNDVEMMDLSASNVTTRTFTRGNHEHTATEFIDNDVEKGTPEPANGTACGSFNAWNEDRSIFNYKGYLIGLLFSINAF